VTIAFSFTIIFIILFCSFCQQLKSGSSPVTQNCSVYSKRSFAQRSQEKKGETHIVFNSTGTLEQQHMLARASAEKFPGRGGATVKTRPKNSTIKTLSTLSVPCIKIQRRHGPRCRRPCMSANRTKCQLAIFLSHTFFQGPESSNSQYFQSRDHFYLKTEHFRAFGHNIWPSSEQN